jgi:uncharacterized protein (DUF1501 family)
MHSNNIGMLKNLNLPLVDQVRPALQDRHSREPLESTLIVCTGEMARSPKVNGSRGRDHRPQCGFSLLFSAGAKHELG